MWSSYTLLGVRKVYGLIMIHFFLYWSGCLTSNHVDMNADEYYVHLYGWRCHVIKGINWFLVAKDFDNLLQVVGSNLAFVTYPLKEKKKYAHEGE